MSGFTYKGIDIGNQITSHDSNAATFSNYNLQHTTTSYDYQKPLDFNLSEGGSSLHNVCTAAQDTIKNNVTDGVVPNGAKSVRLLMRSGQGGKGGTAGNAKAKANSNSATGYGGWGALGGWNMTSLTDVISIPEESKYAITIGTVGKTGVTGNSKSTQGGANGNTTTSGTGGTGGQGGPSSITFYNGNVIDSNYSVNGGTGGTGGNPAKAKANNTNGNTSSNQGNNGPQPLQPNQQTTANGGSPPSGHPDIDSGNPTGFVQIVWLYD